MPGVPHFVPSGAEGTLRVLIVTSAPDAQLAQAVANSRWRTPAPVKMDIISKSGFLKQHIMCCPFLASQAVGAYIAPFACSFPSRRNRDSQKRIRKDRFFALDAQLPCPPGSYVSNFREQQADLRALSRDGDCH